MKLLPGIQTHINEWIDPSELAFVAAHGYQIARIDAMLCSDEVAQICVRDAEAAGLRPFITIADPARMRLFPGRDIECRNEDDGDLTPRAYRRILNDMAALVPETGCRLWGPTCSNTNEKCVWWARFVRGSGWPTGMHGLSWHSYDPHENREWDAVKALADGMPIILSEFGYPNLPPTTEDEQAEKLRELWALYDTWGVYGAIHFQIHDGPDPLNRESFYGIRRMDNTWKPSAFTVPNSGTILPNQETPMFVVHDALRRTDAIPHPDKPGYFTSPHPDKDGTVLCVEADRSIGKRPKGTRGPWETWRDDGYKAVFEETAGGAVAILLVD